MPVPRRRRNLCSAEDYAAGTCPNSELSWNDKKWMPCEYGFQCWCVQNTAFLYPSDRGAHNAGFREDALVEGRSPARAIRSFQDFGRLPIPAECSRRLQAMPKVRRDQTALSVPTPNGPPMDLLSVLGLRASNEPRSLAAVQSESFRVQWL